MCLVHCSIVLLVLSPAVWANANRDVPSWVEEASTKTMPAYAGKVPAAVLIEDHHVTLDASGQLVTTERRAIKILNREGKKSAEVWVPYWKNRREIKDFRAWIVAPGGFEKTFDKNSVMDVGLFDRDALYMDGRARMIKADNPEVGAVFAYEYTVQGKALVAEDEYLLQERLPAVDVRYSVTLPPGWKAKGLLFNSAPVEPIVDGSTYTWELKDLPFRDAEDESGDTMPRLALNFLPPAGSSSSLPVLNSWADVARLQYQFANGQDEVTPEIAAKVKQLTAGATSDYQKICAIGRYVQQTRYVEIAMDLENGGGLVPHAASEVFAKQYGDCKDKANLMRCMLKSAGIEAYLVTIYAGDRTHVRKEWPSPEQFNHMIVAARVSDSVTAASAMATPLGRLLIFDPTNPYTPVGDFPFYEQASYAVLMANERGDLIKMPMTPPEDNRIEISAEATLEPSGKLIASLSSVRSGQPACRERGEQATLKPDEYKNSYQRSISRMAKASVISKLEPQDHFDENKFDVKLSFESAEYAQLMQGRLLVFAPSVVEAPGSILPALPKEEKRAGPIVLHPAVYHKTVRLKLPEGFSIDEAPVPAKYESPFAKFSISFKQEPGVLIVDEDVRTEGVTLPPDQFGAVKKFFDDCRGADRQETVLAKN